VADGEKQAAVLRSEGEKQAAINRAQGEATAIRVIAEATAAGVRAVADAIVDKGGLEAANLKVAQQYVEAFANLAKTSNTLIVPATANDIAGLVARVIEHMAADHQPCRGGQNPNPEVFLAGAFPPGRHMRGKQCPEQEQRQHRGAVHGAW